MRSDRRTVRATVEWAEAQTGAPPVATVADVLNAGFDARAAVLVEGPSDRAALETLARRYGRDLAAEGIAIVAVGGASTFRHFLELLGPGGIDIALAGLYDENEEHEIRKGLEHVGHGPLPTRAALERAGFHACVRDLEDELIRALGPTRVEQVIEAAGELGTFRTFERQPMQREWSETRRLRRFMGTRAGRKERYAQLLVEALDLDRVPAPLERVLHLLPIADV